MAVSLRLTFQMAATGVPPCPDVAEASSADVLFHGDGLPHDEASVMSHGELAREQSPRASAMLSQWSSPFQRPRSVVMTSRCVSPFPAEGDGNSIGELLAATMRFQRDDADSDFDSWSVQEPFEEDRDDGSLSSFFNLTHEGGTGQQVGLVASRHAGGNVGAHDDGSALWSPTSSAFTTSWLSDGSPGRFRTNDAVESAVLEGTLGAMLRRLSDPSLDETGRRTALMQCQRLSDEEIRSLPQIRFESKDPQYCSICLEAFQCGQQLTVLPACSHRYHVNCVAGWMQRATQCPLCRRECCAQQDADAQLLAPPAGDGPAEPFVLTPSTLPSGLPPPLASMQAEEG